MSTLQLPPAPVHSDPADDFQAAHDAWSEGWDDSNPPAEPDFPEPDFPDPDFDELADLALAQTCYESGCLF